MCSCGMCVRRVIVFIFMTCLSHSRYLYGYTVDMWVVVGSVPTSRWGARIFDKDVFWIIRACNESLNRLEGLMTELEELRSHGSSRDSLVRWTAFWAINGLSYAQFWNIRARLSQITLPPFWEGHCHFKGLTPSVRKSIKGTTVPGRKKGYVGSHTVIYTTSNQKQH